MTKTKCKHARRVLIPEKTSRSFKVICQDCKKTVEVKQ